ncbi:hypothetical protein M9H77_36720 [Catharanthus roseus]|uniref:Uncharacterized protein n=1 Tax=Catharanthus roseus TaxID=4058 RepID=A0ACB9ZTH7_CATRO|nr:hypothetical protein M9H77_36720 [Catharanthus roseus]
MADYSTAFVQTWNLMEEGIMKLTNILEVGKPELQFTCADRIILYSAIYDLYAGKSYQAEQKLYDKYVESFGDYITSTVLPSLRLKHGEFMLQELVRRWSIHKTLVRVLSRLFQILDRFYVPRKSLPTLNEVGFSCFQKLVYQELSGEIRDAVISVEGFPSEIHREIHKEREGERIDRSLLKNVVDIFIIGMGKMDYYENDFEAALLNDTASYYSRKASNWTSEDSCQDYLLKAVECLKQEKERVFHYLHSSSETKLLAIVRHELLSSVYATQLLEQEHSRFHAFLRDDQVLFCRVQEL